MCCVLQIQNMASSRERYVRCPPTEPIEHWTELKGMVFELAIDRVSVEIVKGDDLTLALGLGGLRLIDSKDEWQTAKLRKKDLELPQGTRVLIDGHGAGRIVGFESSSFGANMHTVVFDECSGSCSGGGGGGGSGRGRGGEGCSACRQTLQLKDMSWTLEHDVSAHAYHSRLQGWMEKLGGMRQNWLGRYFVYDPEVSPTTVAYYEDASKRTKKGEVNLSSVTSARLSSAPNAQKGEIEVLSPERTWRFIVKDPGERAQWLTIFDATHGPAEEGSTLMVESRSTTAGKSEFLRLNLTKLGPAKTTGGARVSLPQVQLSSDGLLAVTLTDRQVLRLLAVIGNLKRLLKKPKVLDPSAVLALMRAPLDPGATDPGTADFRYPLYVKALSMPKLEIIVQFRRATDLAPRVFKVPKGMSIDGLELELPAIQIEDVHGSGATVKCRLVGSYKVRSSPVARLSPLPSE